jgi:hypothetical protein
VQLCNKCRSFHLALPVGNGDPISQQT